MTHHKGDTTARLAEPLGYVPLAHGIEAVRLVAAIFRDHGNRSDRRHARLKYLLAEWGISRFREEFQRRASFTLGPAVPLPRLPFHDHLGRHRQADGRWFYGVFVQSGRIGDTPGHGLKRALHEIVDRHRPGIRLTAQQNLLLTGLDPAAIDDLEATLRRHGVTPAVELAAVRRYSVACPALPTCGLALAESERAIPALLDRLEAELEGLGLRDEPLTVRMTGCPNGCARPYTADIAFVGRSLGLYNVYVGGGLAGDRLVDLYRADVPVEEILAPSALLALGRRADRGRAVGTSPAAHGLARGAVHRDRTRLHLRPGRWRWCREPGRTSSRYGSRRDHSANALIRRLARRCARGAVRRSRSGSAGRPASTRCWTSSSPTRPPWFRS
jgi:sulfite reductase beta subunit-like hemoprotein